MSSIPLTEQHQLEQFTQWWKKYGVITIIIVLIALAAGLGWHFWLQHREVKLKRGSTHYEELLNTVVNEDDTSALKEANLLKNNYAHTSYAALATLVLARNQVYLHHYTEAKNYLNWVMKHANTDSFREVARLRLSRILLEEKNPQEALNVLKKVDDNSYQPLIEELKGDSYSLLNQNDNARNAYQLALNSLPHYAEMRPLLVMKRDNLATEEDNNV